MFHWRYALVAILAYIADQVTKFWAFGRLSNPEVMIQSPAFEGGKDLPIPSGEHIQVVGDYVRWTLAYNPGSAFSMKPGALVPFLNPTIFYAIITVLAGVGLFYYFMRSLPQNDRISRYGIYLIMAGALGNFSDRLRLDVVIDFIDCDWPDFLFMQRWPVFNLADSWVCIGICLIMFGPNLVQWLSKKKS